ncbi:uncharacterized protein LOC100830030 isoform X1 [Brachypodium distachyon]|uniref:Myb-like domain-containing protein n=1 Tax=Brachypodium distachyon TaxID=15368 RepID=A0A0Q3IG03_BRADI|nr:uncharacterized protein LOC100830030 isoform X1 [Brachypodium distachyon]KQJ99603.1 hypothetical protein BRADI_3g44217v3 [Brachypodium distachyon]|eukprot:XP_003572559.1 uncharacterized protein LOC100830030 isoform X1 [Brachypodium distachyon]
MPPPSASASRFAAHWVADALAGDEALDFSVIKALVGVSPESLAGAPEVTRERVSLRCLQEVVSVATEGEGEGEVAVAVARRILRVDDTRSCEELLLELIGQVGSSGSLENGMLAPFSQDIQKFICIKIPALPKTSFELLREVDPEILSMVPPFPVQQNGNNELGNDRSLCNASHDHVNTEKLGCPTDTPELQQDSLTNFANETDTRNLQKDPMEPNPDFHQPSTSHSRCYDHLREDTGGATGVNTRSPEKSPTNVDRNMSFAAEPSPASCSAALLKSNTEPMPKQDEEDHSTMLQPQSYGDKYPNPPRCNDGDRPCYDGSNNQSSKDQIHEGSTIQAMVAPDFGRSTEALATNTSETSRLSEFVTAEDAAMIAETDRSKTDLNSPQHDNGEKASQELDEGSARIQSVEKDNEPTLQTAGVLPSANCDGAIQGDKSETSHPQENTTDHTKMLEQQNGDKAHLEVGSADKVNPGLHDDAYFLKHTALESPCCNVALHNRSSEGDSLSEKNTGKCMADIQKSCCIRSVPNSPQDGNDEGAKRASNEKIMGNPVVETSHVYCSDDSSTGLAAACLLSMTGKIPICSQVEGLTEQDLCVKCGQDGQLLRCSSCLLAAHDSCFGSSVTFDDSGQFYCAVCFYTKATEAYQKAKKIYAEARKNLSAFLGPKQFAKQHAEQYTEKQQTAANFEDHLNGCNTSKRQDNHQSEADNLSHKDEEPGQQRKKQKTNATSDTCPEQVVTEKAAPYRDCVLQYKTKQVQVAEHEQPVENAKAHEDGNGNSFHEAQHSSQNRCSPVANQNVEADNDDGLTNSHECENSDEIEATSSNDSGKRSSPPWRNMRHHKARFREKETVVSNNSKKALGCQDQNMPSPSRQRKYAYPPKRYSNPLAPAGRRTKLCWTEEEEGALRDAMLKFTPKDNGSIPWVQILEHGRGVFHKTRLPSDLRVKWRNMNKKSGS